MAEHIVSSYDNDLQGLRRRISEMGGIAEKMMADASHALVRRDTVLAQAVIAADKRLDVLQREIGVGAQQRADRPFHHLLGVAAHLRDGASEAGEIVLEGRNDMLRHPFLVPFSRTGR